MKKINRAPAAKLPEMPDFGQCWIPVSPAAFLDRIRADVPAIAGAELAELQSNAREEAALAVAAESLTEASAKAEYEAMAEQLRKSPTPENVQKLKDLPPLAAMLDHYHRERHALMRAGKELRKKSLPAIEAVSCRLVARVIELADVARQEEAALYASWGVQPPSDSFISRHLMRSAQEIAINLSREKGDIMTGVGICGLLAMLGLEP